MVFPAEQKANDATASPVRASAVFSPGKKPDETGGAFGVSERDEMKGKETKWPRKKRGAIS
jgi:hypothetical protein